MSAVIEIRRLAKDAALAVQFAASKPSRRCSPFEAELEAGQTGNKRRRLPELKELAVDLALVREKPAGLHQGDQARPRRPNERSGPGSGSNQEVIELCGRGDFLRLHTAAEHPGTRCPPQLHGVISHR
jgi:hypothetical protein